MGLMDRIRYALTPTGPIGDVTEGEVGRVDPDHANLRYGSTGDRETNPDLYGRARYPVYDSMWMSESPLKAAFLAVRESIAQGTFTITPASTDPVDMVVADMVTRNLGVGLAANPDGWMAGTWTGLIRRLVHGRIAYGSMTEEILWGPVSTWTDQDGDEHTIRPLWRLSPRYPHTIEEYLPPAPGDRYPLGGVRQDGVKDVIPGAKLVHTVQDPEGGEHVGVSMLRAAYGPWKLKRKLIVDASIAFDRHLAGTPVVRHPDNTSAQRRAEDIGRSLRLHERAYVTFPGPPPSDLNPDGWDLTWERGEMGDPIPFLHYLDHLMVTSFLAAFLGLGTTETGSRAVGEVLAEPFYLALNAVAEDLAADLTNQLVRTIVRVNFGGDVAIPSVTFGRLNYRSLEALGRFIADLGSAGMNVTDRALQQHVRAVAGLPLLADDEPDVPEGTGDPAAAAMPEATIAGDPPTAGA